MLELFQYDFMWRALIAGLMVGAVAPLIGMFLVVRRFSLLADTLSHVTLMGVALSFIFNTNPIMTALGTSLAAAVGIERLRARRTLFGESILALFLSGSLAIASLLLSRAQGLNAAIFNALFGSILTVTRSDILLIALLGSASAITIFLIFKELFFSSFDEELAQASGVNVRTLNILLIVTAAAVVSVAMRVVGILLVGALMVIPVLTAMNFRRGFKTTLSISLAVSLVSVIAGLIMSFYAGFPTGGTIILINILLFIISMSRRVGRAYAKSGRLKERPPLV